MNDTKRANVLYTQLYKSIHKRMLDLNSIFILMYSAQPNEKN